MSNGPPNSLGLPHVDEEAELLAPELLDNLIEVHLHSGAPDLPRLISFLERCPRVTEVSCGSERIVTEADPAISSQVVPMLLRFRGPLPLAIHLVPGRRLEEIYLHNSTDFVPRTWPSSALRPLGSGCRSVRRADVSSLTWNDDCIQDLAYVFPNVERLHFAAEGMSTPYWLEDHLAETIQQFPKLQDISASSSSHQSGVATEERLESQRLTLEAARAVHPLLSTVSFHSSVRWRVDSAGCWSARSDTLGRCRLLYSPLDYAPPELRTPIKADSSDSPRQLRSLALLPPELLLHLVDAVQSIRRPLFPRQPAAEDLSTQVYDLKNLSLVNQTLRAIAQPALFRTIELVGEAHSCVFRARKLRRMFDARAGSWGWVKALRLAWNGPEHNDPEGTEVQEELARVVFDMFRRFDQLQECEFGAKHLIATTIRIPPEAYAHLFHLPELRAIALEPTCISNIIPPLDTPFENLRLQHLQLNHPWTTAAQADAVVYPGITRLAHCSTLRKLVLPLVTPQIISQIGGQPPHIFSNLTALELYSRKPHADMLPSLLSLTPNITSLSIAFPHLTNDGTLDIEPGIIPAGAIPRLNVIKGPLNVIRLLVPHRPVSSITVVGTHVIRLPYSWSTETIRPLRAGSVPVTELNLHSLEWKPDALDIISELFPDIAVLRIGFFGTEPQIQCWLSDKLPELAQRWPHLRIIHNTSPKADGELYPVHQPDLFKERETLERASIACATLQEVIIHHGYIWTKDQGGAWLNRRASKMVKHFRGHTPGLHYAYV